MLWPQSCCMHPFLSPLIVGPLQTKNVLTSFKFQPKIFCVLSINRVPAPWQPAPAAPPFLNPPSPFECPPTPFALLWHPGATCASAMCFISVSYRSTIEMALLVKYRTLFACKVSLSVLHCTANTVVAQALLYIYTEMISQYLFCICKCLQNMAID